MRPRNSAVIAAVLALCAGGVSLGGASFLRGDANQDGRKDIADAVMILGHLFNQQQTTCRDACDANDDGKLDIADPIRLLAYLFANGAPLPPPFTRCDEDLTSDALGCEAFNAQLCGSPLPSDPAVTRANVRWQTSLAACEGTIEIPAVAGIPYRWGTRQFQRIRLWHAGSLSAVGKPELPFYVFLFAIPRDAGTDAPASYDVEVGRAEELAYDRVLAFPAQPPAWDGGEAPVDAETPPFAFDAPFYAGSESYPSRTFAADTFQLGNAAVLRVMVFPVTYTPAARRLTLARKLTVKVAFSSAGGLAAPSVVGDYTDTRRDGEAHSAPFFANRMLVQRLDAGDLAAPLAPRDPASLQDPACALLVVTRPELFEQARRLAAWRQDQGWRVHLAALDRARFPTADSIRAFIQDLDARTTATFRMDGRDIARRCLNAILIVGDVEHIPAFTGLPEALAEAPPEGAEYVALAGTDLYYATPRGDDDVPDVAIGRLPIDSLDEAAAVIDKIVHNDSLLASSLPRRIAVYGAFQDDITAQNVLSGALHFRRLDSAVTGTDTRLTTEVRLGEHIRVATEAGDGRWYTVASIESDTRLRLAAEFQEADADGAAELGFRDGRADRPFVDTCERVRRFMEAAGAGVTWGYRKGQGPPPAFFEDGAPLPPELAADAWKVDAAAVNAEWTTGRNGIILHRGRASADRWDGPPFGAASLYPFETWDSACAPLVLSIDSRTGWFDGETDVGRRRDGSLAPFPGSDESFAEKILRMPRGGALAVVAATRAAASGRNEVLAHAMLRSFYADYDDASLLPVSPDWSRPELGVALHLAKLHLALSLDDDAAAAYYLEIYHLLGDPTATLPLPGP